MLRNHNNYNVLNSSFLPQDLSMLKTALMPVFLAEALLIDNQTNPANVFTECEQERMSYPEVPK